MSAKDAPRNIRKGGNVNYCRLAVSCEVARLYQRGALAVAFCTSGRGHDGISSFRKVGGAGKDEPVPAFTNAVTLLTATSETVSIVTKGPGQQHRFNWLYIWLSVGRARRCALYAGRIAEGRGKMGYALFTVVRPHTGLGAAGPLLGEDTSHEKQKSNGIQLT